VLKNYYYTLFKKKSVDLFIAIEIFVLIIPYYSHTFILLQHNFARTLMSHDYMAENQ